MPGVASWDMIPSRVIRSTIHGWRVGHFRVIAVVPMWMPCSWEAMGRESLPRTRRFCIRVVAPIQRNPPLLLQDTHVLRVFH